MGRTILCPHCKSTFDEDILKKRNSEDICLVCGESLLGDEDISSHDEPLSFGDGIELGENDSFDEDKIDFWWYEIEKYSDDDIDIDVTCTSCGTHSFFSYPPIAVQGDYVLSDPREHRKCSYCGKELKNHILSKRPADWVDPRKRSTQTTDWENLPKCPICNSTKIHKISLTNKAASAITFGIFAAGHVSKTFKCDTCGAKF